MIFLYSPMVKVSVLLLILRRTVCMHTVSVLFFRVDFIFAFFAVNDQSTKIRSRDNIVLSILLVMY